MNNEHDRSLGDDATLGGHSRPLRSAVSIGDERTLGDNRSGQDTVIDDIEVVDLEARYKVEGTLGQGGMGAVLLATDTRLDRRVAIKRILGEAAGNRMAVQRFLTEAKAIAALNHPNIVQIYDYGRAKDGPFLIMEYVDGGSLLDRCREGALPLDEAIDLACQLCDGLAKAHDLGIVHRDIKPANVLLTKDGVPKLTDFGLAKAQTSDHGQTMTGAVLGTPDFMPPEQRRDASLVDHRSDLWSLAATVYQMVTGRSPKIIRFDLLPTEVTKILGKALEDAKDARYQSARDLRDALKTSLRSAAPVTAVAAVGEGQCPSCGVQNDASRKFCRGCGASLFAPCLKCTQQMPMWEEICGSCGEKQAPLVEAKRAEMAAAQARAEGLLGDFDFEDAASIVATLRDEPHPRLSHLRAWAERFLQKIDKGRVEQFARAADAVTEARAHEKAHDYAAGIRVLEPLPHAVRMLQLPALDATAGEVLNRLERKLQETKSLEAGIRAAIKSRVMSGLLEKVVALANLQPDRVDVAKLRGQLEERRAALARQRDVLLQQAKQAVKKQDYAAAVKILSQVDGDVVNSEVGRLRADAKQREDRAGVLREEIKIALVEKDHDEVLRLTDEYLSLKAATPELEEIRSQAAAEKRRAQNRKQWRRLAIAAISIVLIGMWVSTQVTRAARAKHAAEIKAALEDGKWDVALTLAPGNVPAYVGRARTKLKMSPPDVKGAFVDIEQAFKIDSLTPELEALKAEAHVVRAQELARDDKLEEATEDLAAARELWPSSNMLLPAEQVISSLWVSRAERAGRAGDLTALQAATTAAGAASADSQRLIEAWRGFATSRIAEADANGLKVACEELAKLQKLSSIKTEAAEWWLQLGAVGFERGNALAIQAAVEAAKAVGASGDALAPLQARGMMIEAASLAAKQDMANAAAKVLEASLLDTAVTTSALKHSANAALRQAVVANYRTNFDAAIGKTDWDSCLRIAASASEIDDTASVWLSSAISSHPGGLATVPTEVIGRLPATTFGLLPPKSFAELPPATIVSLPLASIAAMPPAVVAGLPPLKNSIGMELKLIPAGTFTMGQAGGKADETPHQVTLSTPFYIGVYEVTINEWKWVSGSTAGELNKDGDHPMNMTWHDAISFCEKLSQLPEEREAGRVYGLPTEAEWEYACRAGTTTMYSFGDDETQLEDYGWYRDDLVRKPYPVGKKKPNQWGLYDMHGNVMEWCSDWYADYGGEAMTDPHGPSAASNRVLRGGDCRIDDASNCRSASRGKAPPDSSYWGFRVVLAVPERP